MADRLVIAVLAWLHIISAMFWLGGHAFLLMIFRWFDTMSPPSREEMILKVYPLLIRWLRTVSSATILFGLPPLPAFSNGNPAFFFTSFGQSIAVGGALGLVAYVHRRPVRHPILLEGVGHSEEGQRGPLSGNPPPELQKHKHNSRVATVLAFASIRSSKT